MYAEDLTSRDVSWIFAASGISEEGKIVSVPLRVRLLLLILVWFAFNPAHGQPVTAFGVSWVDGVDEMAFTHDGKFLYSADYLIIEYDPIAGRFERIHQIRGSRTRAIAGFPGDSRVAIATEDGWLYVWDRDSGAILASSRFFTQSEPGRGPKLTISGSGDLIAMLHLRGLEYDQDNQLTLLDAETLTPISPPLGGETHFSGVPPVFSPDGLYLFAAAKPGGSAPMDLGDRIVKWSFLNDTLEIVKGDFGTAFLNALAFESDGLRYGLGSHDRYVCYDSSGCGFALSYIWIDLDWSSWLQLPDASVTLLTSGMYTRRTCGSGCYAERIGFAGAPSVLSPGGKYMVRDHLLTEISTGVVRSESAPERARFNHDGTLVAGVAYEGDRYDELIQIMASEQGRVISRIPIDFGAYFSAFTVNESARSLTGIQNNRAIRYDLDSGGVLGIQSVPTSSSNTNGAIASPGEDFMAVYTKKGAIVGDGDGLTTHTMLLPNESVSSACVNPSNNRLLLVAKELREYEVNLDDFARTTLTRRYEAVAGDRSVYEDAAYTPDGEFLLAASGVVRKFNTADGGLIGVYDLDLPCHSLKIDPSGSFLVCGLKNKTERLLQIYRLDTMKRVGDFSIPEQGFDFLAAGLVFLTTDGRLWQTDNGEYLGSIRRTGGYLIYRVVGSRTSDMAWLSDNKRILGWRIPAERLILEPGALILDELLLRQRVFFYPDRNGDGVLDVADVLLASRSEPPSAGAADIVRVPSRERGADSEALSRSIEERLLPPE